MKNPKNLVLIIRFSGLILFSLLGIYLGNLIAKSFDITVITNNYAMIIGGVVLGALGFFAFPYMTIYPVQTIRKSLEETPGQTLLVAMAGLIVGLIIAALISIPIGVLPAPLNSILIIFALVLFSYLGVTLSVSKQEEIRELLSFARREKKVGSSSKKTGGAGWNKDCSILVDTSVIIDGRIADIAKTGFLPGTLIIPHFVLNELQYIADSAESLRRQRGRRGMEVLSELQKDRNLNVVLSDMDVENVREVDEKLVVLARQMKAPILTNDYNLNRVAELQGVQVLNINELANAVKSILLPGEELTIKIIQEGKEQDQGVAYLDDGTMVVVEDGRGYLDQEIVVTVTKVLQTAAGRMIFSKPGGANGIDKE
ncbi:MAG TPA: PIN domain nuclease [Anaerolineaceae bacterium]|nr:PIN domain nuclease [Anaerolineaceae bacterium]